MTDIKHTAERIVSIAQSFISDPTPSADMAAGMRSMAAYLLTEAAAIEKALEPEPEEPELPEPTEPGQLDTQLDGKRLPQRKPYDLGQSRSIRYGATVRDATRNFGGQQISGVTSAGVIMFGDAVVEDVTVCVSGGDGFKFDGGAKTGSFVIRNAHIHSLGLKPGAHADGLQTRGGVLSGLFEDVFIDMPALVGDGTQANACVIIDSSQRPNGLFTFRRCILRGGNYSVMLGDKGSGNDPGRIHYEQVAFIVEENSPQFGLFGGSFADSRNTYGPGCAVYRLGSDGICRFVTSDVANWHR